MVITITPFAAFVPYTAVAAASFNTSICSISSGFKPDIALPNRFTKSRSFSCSGSIFTGSVSTTPSRTQRGSLLPSKVEVPLILNLGVAPTCPEFCMKIIPGIRPSSIWSTDIRPGTIMSSIFNDVTALVKWRRSKFWYPVFTTTSSI